MALTGFEKPLDQYTRDEIRKIAVLFGIKLSTIIEKKLNKNQVIDLIRNSSKYKEKQSSSKNRIQPLVDKLIGTESADDIMIELLSILKESGKNPIPGKFYVFVYNAKTPGMRYDQNPLVAVTSVYNWGFKAINFHWEEGRQYTWDEIAGGMYEVYEEEIENLRRLPFANFKTK